MDAGDIIYLVLALLAALASAFTRKKGKQRKIFNQENRIPGKDPFFPDWDEEEPTTPKAPLSTEGVNTPQQQDYEWESEFFPTPPTTAVVPPETPPTVNVPQPGINEGLADLKSREISNGISTPLEELEGGLLKTKQPPKVHPIVREIRKPPTLRNAIIYAEVLKQKWG